MDKGEEPQQTHDRLMDIVNERRAYEDNIKDEEVNYKLHMALRMWNPTLCTIIEENDGFESYTTDDVIGRINAHKSRDDEGKRVNVLIGDESISKKDIALKANDEDDENDDDEEDNEEFALFVKKFGKYMIKNVFTKKSFDKAKARRTNRRCYKCHEQGHMIAHCPRLNGKGKKSKKYNNKNKPNNKPYNKGQAHIGQEYISDDDEEDDEGGIANIAIGLPPAKKSLFNNLIDDEDDAPRCFMAKETKISYKESWIPKKVL
ncbi:hypothetical protein QOZ80_7AG0563520 [Eleusine coracana subsp. coracana]|nr:hypothetical protein QOZ80_7AG0563520 [Eleusine coracana subsp. coracana]